MTPLRRRMTDEMTLRNFAPRIIQAYVRYVDRYFNRSTDRLGPSRSAPTFLQERRVSKSDGNVNVRGSTSHGLPGAGMTLGRSGNRSGIRATRTRPAGAHGRRGTRRESRSAGADRPALGWEGSGRGKWRPTAETASTRRARSRRSDSPDQCSPEQAHHAGRRVARSSASGRSAPS